MSLRGFYSLQAPKFINLPINTFISQIIDNKRVRLERNLKMSKEHAELQYLFAIQSIHHTSLAYWQHDDLHALIWIIDGESGGRVVF